MDLSRSLFLLLFFLIIIISVSLPFKSYSKEALDFSIIESQFHTTKYLVPVIGFSLPYHTLPLNAKVILSHTLSPYYPFGTKWTVNNKLSKFSKCTFCEAIVSALTIEFNYEGIHEFYIFKYYHLISVIKTTLNDVFLIFRTINWKIHDPRLHFSTFWNPRCLCRNYIWICCKSILLSYLFSIWITKLTLNIVICRDLFSTFMSKQWYHQISSVATYLVLDLMVAVDTFCLRGTCLFQKHQNLYRVCSSSHRFVFLPRGMYWIK